MTHGPWSVAELSAGQGLLLEAMLRLRQAAHWHCSHSTTSVHAGDAATNANESSLNTLNPHTCQKKNI